MGILRQNLIQELRPVVEGQAHMADLPLRLQLEGGLVGAAGLVLGVALPVLGVHQVEVKVVHAAVMELLLKKRTDVLLLLKKAVGQLVRQQEFLPAVPAGQALADG